MFFSGTQKKAESLAAEARQALVRADETFHETLQNLKEAAARLRKTREAALKKGVARFAELSDAIADRPFEVRESELPDEEERIESLVAACRVEPVTIRDVTGGKAGAFFTALIVSLLALVAALIGGAVGSGQPLAPETFTQMPKLMRIFEWLGGGFIAPRYANPFVGIGALLLLLWLVWLIVRGIKMGKAARKNLAVAETMHEDACRYADEKSGHCHNLTALTRELTTLEELLYTCQIYLDEYNASLRRILHTEGDRFDNFKASSRQLVERANACTVAMRPLLESTVSLETTDPSKQIRQSVVYGTMVVEALIREEPIPPFDPEAVEARIAAQQAAENAKNAEASASEEADETDRKEPAVEEEKKAE